MGEEAAWQAFHSAYSEARQDVPRTGEATPLLYDVFRRRAEAPDFLPEGVLLAVTDAGEVAAFTELHGDAADPGRLNTGLTGTRRAFRRQGLALALKLAALDVARQRGAQSVWTNNATTNVPMLTLNERLDRDAARNCEAGQRVTPALPSVNAPSLCVRDPTRPAAASS